MPATSKLTRSSRTVLLRMAADQERADRIRSLKQDNPQLKWRHIADHVGVELRSAQMWQETGAISYDNAKKLAELVSDPERDVDWIMRGPRKTAPNPFAGQDDLADRLDAIERALEAASQERVQHAADIQKLLRRQNAVLKDIENAITAEKTAKAEAEGARRRLLESAEAASRTLADATRRLEAARGTRAT